MVTSIVSDARKEAVEAGLLALEVREQRMKLAYEASGQIDVLVGLLMREQRDSGDYAADVVLSTLLRRLDQLNGVVFAVLSHDDVDPTERLRAVVNAGRIAEEVSHG